MSALNKKMTRPDLQAGTDQSDPNRVDDDDEYLNGS
jgi:hypothetical protein